MKLLAVICLSLALIGCSTVPTTKIEPQIIVKQKLIPLTIPAEMFEMPPYPDAVDPRKMTDKDAAIWLIENEKRNQEIDKRLTAIKKYQEQRLKDFQPALTD